MFRTIVIFSVLALCAFLAGWFTIQRDPSETTIRFNRDEIRADTSKAIAKGKELLHRVEGDLSSDDVVPQQANLPVAPWDQPFQYDPQQYQPQPYQPIQPPQQY